MIAIYALCGPAGEIRYVGRSFDPAGRLRQHLADAGDSPKATWLRGLGHPPTLRVLELVEESDAPRVEERWIRRLRERGLRLTNVRGSRERRPSRIRQHRTPEQLVELWKTSRQFVLAPSDLTT